MLTLVCLTLAVSCVTEYQPDNISIEPALVVEGEITDQPGPYVVRLTRTADYSVRSINLLETGAAVSIEDNLGNRETLIELPVGGIYWTRANGIRGVAGRRYKLSIQTKAGRRYESTLETLASAPPIDTLYYEYRNDPVAGTAVRKQGWDVYLDTQDPDTTGNFYRWEWTHYEPISVCQKTQLPSGTFTGLNCCSPCWDIGRCFDCIDLNSDVNVNGRAISRQLIMRVPYTSQSRYYLEVQQQALSRGAYQYWKSVRQLITSTGGLFDAAPSSVRGNVRCVSDPGQTVYGYFGATGISERYIYVDRSTGQGSPEMEPPVFVPQPSGCVPCANDGYRTSVKPRWWTY